MSSEAGKHGSAGGLSDSIAIGPLRHILQQAIQTPQHALHRRLQEKDGRLWADRLLGDALLAAGEPGGDHLPNAPREVLESLKDEGKHRIRRARDQKEQAEAALLYFTAVSCLLGDPETTSSREVTSLPLPLLEDSILILRETLGEAWHPPLDRALLRFC